MTFNKQIIFFSIRFTRTSYMTYHQLILENYMSFYHHLYLHILINYQSPNTCSIRGIIIRVVWWCNKTLVFNKSFSTSCKRDHKIKKVLLKNAVDTGLSDMAKDREKWYVGYSGFQINQVKYMHNIRNRKIING